MAKILSSSKENLIQAAAHINNGGLVAFPTETVYGLGAKLEDNSLKKIFEAKKRPFSDPLIVHFASPEKTKEFISLTSVEAEIFTKISTRFWPGPLTIVCKSTSKVPPLVMAGTGCIGVRVPNHKICHEFLELADVPIAAPSANLFSHISPTSAEHVMNDLGNVDDLIVISGGESPIGIESTVIQLNDNKVIVLRPGFITGDEIGNCIGIKVETAIDKIDKAASPGHEDKHYAPRVNAYLIDETSGTYVDLVEGTILIDFRKIYSHLSTSVLRYFDLSPVGSVKDAVKNIYSYLRDAELTPGVKQILIVDVSNNADESESQLSLSLKDRLLRSSSHQTRKLRK